MYDSDGTYYYFWPAGHTFIYFIYFIYFLTFYYTFIHFLSDFLVICENTRKTKVFSHQEINCISPNHMKNDKFITLFIIFHLAQDTFFTLYTFYVFTIYYNKKCHNYPMARVTRSGPMPRVLQVPVRSPQSTVRYQVGERAFSLHRPCGTLRAIHKPHPAP